jgi:uncharacterized membrane protein YwaF
MFTTAQISQVSFFLFIYFFYFFFMSCSNITACLLAHLHVEEFPGSDVFQKTAVLVIVYKGFTWSL